MKTGKYLRTKECNDAHKGWHQPVEAIKKIKEKRTKQVITDEHRRHIAEGHRGAKSHFWRGGIWPEHLRIKRSIEYRLWRKAVFERDNYTCRFCGIRGGKLHADHIKPFALYPELRFAIDNGRTLCVPCHRKTDTFGWNTMNKLRNNH